MDPETERPPNVNEHAEIRKTDHRRSHKDRSHSERRRSRQHHQDPPDAEERVYQEDPVYEDEPEEEEVPMPVEPEGTTPRSNQKRRKGRNISARPSDGKSIEEAIQAGAAAATNEPRAPIRRSTSFELVNPFKGKSKKKPIQRKNSKIEITFSSDLKRQMEKDEAQREREDAEEEVVPESALVVEKENNNRHAQDADERRYDERHYDDFEGDDDIAEDDDAAGDYLRHDGLMHDIGSERNEDRILDDSRRSERYDGVENRRSVSFSGDREDSQRSRGVNFADDSERERPLTRSQRLDGSRHSRLDGSRHSRLDGSRHSRLDGSKREGMTRSQRMDNNSRRESLKRSASTKSMDKSGSGRRARRSSKMKRSGSSRSLSRHSGLDGSRRTSRSVRPGLDSSGMDHSASRRSVRSSTSKMSRMSRLSESGSSVMLSAMHSMKDMERGYKDTDYYEDDDDVSDLGTLDEELSLTDVRKYTICLMACCGFWCVVGIVGLVVLLQLVILADTSSSNDDDALGVNPGAGGENARFPPDWGAEDRYGISGYEVYPKDVNVTVTYTVSEYIDNDSFFYFIWEGSECRSGFRDVTNQNYLLVWIEPDAHIKDTSGSGVDAYRQVNVTFRANTGRMPSSNLYFEDFQDPSYATIGFCLGFQVTYNRDAFYQIKREVNYMETYFEVDVDVNALPFYYQVQSVPQTIDITLPSYL